MPFASICVDLHFCSRHMCGYCCCWVAMFAKLSASRTSSSGIWTRSSPSLYQSHWWSKGGSLTITSSWRWQSAPELVWRHYWDTTAIDYRCTIMPYQTWCSCQVWQWGVEALGGAASEAAGRPSGWYDLLRVPKCCFDMQKWIKLMQRFDAEVAWDLGYDLDMTWYQWMWCNSLSEGREDVAPHGHQVQMHRVHQT